MLGTVLRAVLAKRVKWRVPGQESSIRAESWSLREVDARNALARWTAVEEPPSEKAWRRTFVLNDGVLVIALIAGWRDWRFLLVVR